MDLQKIREGLINLKPKDKREAEKLLNDEDYESLLFLVDSEIDEVGIDAEVASAEDNPKIVEEKSALLDALIRLKYAIEDYIDLNSWDEEEEYYDD